MCVHVCVTWRGGLHLSTSFTSEIKKEAQKKGAFVETLEELGGIFASTKKRELHHLPVG